MEGPRGAAGLLLLIVLTGCAGDRPSARPASTEGPAAAPSAIPSPATAPGSAAGPTAEPAPAGEPTEPAEQRCDHPTQGYSVAFPAGWSVAGGDGIEPCTLFHPQQLTLEPNSEATGVAIRAEVRDVPFDQARLDAEAVSVLDAMAGSLEIP